MNMAALIIRFAKSLTVFIILSQAMDLYSEQIIHVAATGALSLHSSLERSGREFGCPQESIALTCSVNGTVLVWDHTNGNTIFTFSPAESGAGNGFSHPELVNCDGGAGNVRASGVLEIFEPNRDSNFSIFNSILTLTPSPDCAHVSLSVTCKSGSGPEMSTTFKVAAVPIAPDHGQITCSYDEYQQSCITVLEVKVNKAAVITQNQDTSDINLITLMTALGAELSISPNTATNSDYITANFLYTDECEREEQFHVSVKLIDKCGQQSSLVVIKCEPKDSSTESGKSSKTPQEYMTLYWFPTLFIVTICTIVFCKH